MDFGFGVWGSGILVSGLGLRDYCFGFRVQGPAEALCLLFWRGGFELYVCGGGWGPMVLSL